MKRLVAVLLLMAFVLAGCSRDPVVLLDNDVVSVVRSGRVIHVVDVETGEACGLFHCARKTQYRRSIAGISRRKPEGNLRGWSDGYNCRRRT